MNSPPTDIVANWILAEHHPAMKLLTRYLGILHDGQVLKDPLLQSLAVAHMRDLMALALDAPSAAEPTRKRRLRAARLRAIKAHIADNLSGDLSLTATAARQGVTARYVRMLFEQEGTSFTAYVLEQRLARAHHLLSDHKANYRPITSIAHDAGFGDLSYFNRCFRRRYGKCPSAVRADARVARERPAALFFKELL